MSTICFWAASGVVAVTIVLHVVFGGIRYVRPLLASELDPFIKWLSYTMWHVGTVATITIGVGFAAAAMDPSRTDYAIAATLTAAGFVIVAAYAGIRSGLGIFSIPVVPLFGIVTALGVTGLLV
ncbi:MAG: hypothetical protein AAF292_03445 [Pseudomonadota bacterium]